MTISKDVNLEQSFEKMKKPTPVYGLRRFRLTGGLVLTKDDEPVLSLPDHLQHDFTLILSKVSAYDKFIEGKEDANDLPDGLFNQNQPR